MDRRPWLWRKKSTEKAIVTTDKINVSSKEKEDEVQPLTSDKAALQKDLNDLKNKLSCALSDCGAKEVLVKKHEKVAEDAIAGREKAESESVYLKQELDKILQQKVACEERVINLDAALKECTQQLRFVRDEQEKRIQDAVITISKEFEESRSVLEDKLAETTKRLAKVSAENTHISKALLEKEKVVEELNRQKAQVETDVKALMSRLDSVEKENGSLKYDVHVLEKEREIRNEDREFNRRAAEAAHKQQLENVKKIAKLESECQRLRLLLRKRLPGPAALAKMKNEVEIMGKDSVGMRRKKLNSNSTAFITDISVEKSPDPPTKKIHFLTQQLLALEEENKSLKEVLNKKTNELQLSKIMYARTSPKTSQMESQFEESSRSGTVKESTRSNLMSLDISLASMSDFESDDKFSCAESWASALISELEHFKNEKKNASLSCTSIGTSDINLMDDFLEMEKLALASTDQTSRSCQTSSDRSNAFAGPLKIESSGNSPWVKCGKIVTVSDSLSGLSTLNRETLSRENSSGEHPGWIQDIVKVVVEQNHMTQRDFHDILQDVRLALENLDDSNTRKVEYIKRSLKYPEEPNSSSISGYTLWDPLDRTSVKDLTNEETVVDISVAEKGDLSKSISKVIELIEGITLPSSDYGNNETLFGNGGSLVPPRNAQTPTGYVVRVFQWKISELRSVLEQFVHSCYNLLNGRADVNIFAEGVSSALEWILNHCFSLQDVSSMKDAIKKHFDWDDCRSESEAEHGMIGHPLESEKLSVSLPFSIASDGHSNSLHLEEHLSIMREEKRELKDEAGILESTVKDLEGRPQSAIDKSESLKNQLPASKKFTERLQEKLETSEESRETVGNRNESPKLMNEDLDRQLAAAKVELDNSRQKLSSLQIELENKTNCCEELESKCLELQLELESVTKRGTQNNDYKQEEKQLRTDWEITAASEKLAECQETILNLGKQLKALAPPREAVLFDKLVSAPKDTAPTTASAVMEQNPGLSKKNKNQRSSLLDQMLTEDDAKVKNLESPNRSEVTGDLKYLVNDNNTKETLEKIENLNGVKCPEDVAETHSLAVVPVKKKSGGSLWRKLSWKKKSSSKKTQLQFPTITNTSLT